MKLRDSKIVINGNRVQSEVKGPDIPMIIIGDNITVVINNNVVRDEVEEKVETKGVLKRVFAAVAMSDSLINVFAWIKSLLKL